VPHGTGLIATVATGIGLAFLLGFAATRLRLPPLLGYLVAGILVGPFTPGYVADSGLAQELAEIGIVLLMFGVGIHFSLDDLLAVRRIALPGAVVQIAVATAFGTLASRLWGWSWGSGLVFGLCLSVASTVVLLRALDGRGTLDTVDGRIAVGWLIVEDLVTVLVLVLLPALAGPLGGTTDEARSPGGSSVFLAVGLTLAKVSAFVGLMLVVGRRAVPWLLARVARTRSRELFTLAVLAVALGIAVGAAALFDVSLALGAFFAGTVVNGSDLSHEAATEALPLQDAFSVLFFVAVGMLFDPSTLVRHPFEVAAVVLIIVIGKSIAAFLIVLAFRYPINTALTISASLAQIGEFSFILAALATRLGLLPKEGESLIVAGALISIGLNPLAFAASARTGSWLARRPRLLALLERNVVRDAARLPPTSHEQEAALDHVVVVGYGRVGSAIVDALERRRIPFVVIEQNRDLVESPQHAALPIVPGDAAHPNVLRDAHVDRARLLVLATPDPYQARAIVERARAANPNIEIMARTHSETERNYLEHHGVARALVGERELALALARHALTRMGCAEADATATIEALRHGQH
jgi:CPA2 family monovalent cation:H+ antiporter-2